MDRPHRPQISRLAAETLVGTGAHSAPPGAAAGASLLHEHRRPPLHRAAAWALEGSGWVLLRPIIDFLALMCAVALTTRWPGTAATEPLSVWVGAFPPLVVAVLAARGTYRRRLHVSVLDDVLRVAAAVSLAAMVLVLVDVYVHREPLEGRVLVHLWLLGTAFTGVAALACLQLQRAARRAGVAGRRTLVVGAGLVGERVARRLLEFPEYGLNPIGFLDADPLSREDRTVPVLGSPSDLEWIAQLADVEQVVIAFSSTSDSTFVPVVRRSEELGLGVAMVPRLFDALNDRTTYSTLGGLPILGLDVTDPRGLPFAVKHLLDRVIAATVLLLASPLLLAITVAVALSSPGPILFRQRRVGRDGRPFNLLKFRSMYMPRSAEAGFVPLDGSAPGGVEGADRRTGVGRLLRRTSLDELPQLINVLRGEMSLVGPRPERPEFVAQFREDIERYGDRHRVRAGITGWAQVHGLRGQTSIADRAEWDNYYIEHWSLWLDIKILLHTVLAVFRHAD